MRLLLSFALLLGIAQLCSADSILYVIPFTSKSHYIILRVLGLELARKGHDVTVITAFKEKNPPPTYREVMVDDVEIWNVIGDRPNVFTMVDQSTEAFHDKILWRGGKGFTEVTLNSTQVQAFLKENNHFDIVICEQFFQEALYMLAHKYNAPLALITTYGNCMRHNVVTRNPLQLSTVISEFLYVDDPTSLFGRLRNLYFTVYEYVWWKYWFLEENEKMVKKYMKNLPEPVPRLYDLQKNTSIIFYNSHFSVDPSVAYMPNIVEIGGMHLSKSDSELPEDLKNILDHAKEGVVYVNFGSNVRSSELPLEKRNAFVNVFRRLNQTILWKWEDDQFVDKPANLVIRKWFPQKDIFAHPNIKVFISHGGLIGTQEAIYFGIPIIGVPIYADQYNNLLQVKQLGFGTMLQYHEITEQKLETLLHEVLKDQSYKEEAAKVSKRFRDRPLSALDTAVFWIEYVIRNKGAEYMRNPALKLHWFEYNMLDVYSIILITLLATLYVIVRLVRVLIVFVFSKQSKKRKYE